MKLLNRILSDQHTTIVLPWLYWIRDTCENNICPGCPLKEESKFLRCRVRNIFMEAHPTIIPRFPDLWGLPKSNRQPIAPNSFDFIYKLQWDDTGNPILKLRRQI